MKSFYIIITIFLTLGICSCKTKKSVIDKKETETEKVIIEEKKTEEKKQSETETEKKEEKSVIDEWMKIESDKIIITDKDGTVTEIINPRIDKRKSENKKVSPIKEKLQKQKEKHKLTAKKLLTKKRSPMFQKNIQAKEKNLFGCGSLAVVLSVVCCI